MRRMTQRITVIALALMMTLSMSAVGVFADDSTEPLWDGTVDGDLNVEVSENDDGYVTEAAVTADGWTEPKVTGNVTISDPYNLHTIDQYYGVQWGMGNAEIGGDINVEDEQLDNGVGIGTTAKTELMNYGGQIVEEPLLVDGSVHVGGDINVSGIGIDLDGEEGSEGTITVDGSIRAGWYGIRLNGREGTGYNVNVGKELRADSGNGNAIYVKSNSGTLNVKSGSIYANGDAIAIDNNNGNINITAGKIASRLGGLSMDTNHGTVVINSSEIRVTSDAIVLRDNDLGGLSIVNTGVIRGETSGIMISRPNRETAVVLPSITTWGLETGERGWLANVDYNGSTDQKVTNDLLGSINYILKKDLSMANVLISSASGELGTVKVGSLEYQTLTSGTHVLNVTAPEGSTIKELKSLTGNATIVRNEDGTYTITIPDGGEVTLSAVYEGADNDNSNGTSNDSNGAGGMLGGNTGNGGSTDLGGSGGLTGGSSNGSTDSNGAASNGPAISAGTDHATTAAVSNSSFSGKKFVSAVSRTPAMSRASIRSGAAPLNAEASAVAVSKSAEDVAKAETKSNTAKAQAKSAAKNAADQGATDADNDGTGFLNAMLLMVVVFFVIGGLAYVNVGRRPRGKR